MVIRNVLASPVDRPPPDVPSSMPQPVADYLRKLSLWAQQQIASKLGKQQAAPGYLILSSGGKVFQIVVNDSGVLATQPITPGSTPL